MEKRSIYYEIIIKFVFFIVSFISMILITLKIIKMFPLFKAYSITEEKLYSLFYKTDVGEIFTNMVVLEDSKFIVMLKEACKGLLLSFNWVHLLFLLSFAVLLFASFLYPKWRLVKTYLKLDAIFIFCFLFKYISFALCILHFFKDSVIGLTNGFFFGTIFYILFSFGEFIVLSLFLIKFIFNVHFDLKKIVKLD